MICPVLNKKMATEIYNGEVRCGTYRIADRFKREHFTLLRLIEKHKIRFSRLENKAKPLIIRRILAIKVGHPVDEYLLNYDQLCFLLAMMWNSEGNIEITQKVLKASTIMKAISLLQDFDADESDCKYVYAAMDESGQIKIGISNNPEERIRNLNIGNADQLTLVFTQKKRKILGTLRKF